ncbi:hypothetical protein E2P81_ATG11978 [Venturia nashicola]|uniref:Uncharacterized protein n=1 Tax=Venturia nashicola TaxID=86259 RepID=A0A4Z1P6F2_9PEZI|nr:hypothetical protein E6O75_ATG11673 [Venturia nashicola]TLD24642.1 hypothetical protein E2P81_ATG11978 [Venturia nashicola]
MAKQLKKKAIANLQSEYQQIISPETTRVSECSCSEEMFNSPNTISQTTENTTRPKEVEAIKTSTAGISNKISRGQHFVQNFEFNDSLTNKRDSSTTTRIRKHV